MGDTSTLFSPVWWVSVVITTILLNLVSAYLKPLIDRIGCTFSSSWASRTEKLRRARALRIEVLKGNATEQIHAKLDAVYHGIRGSSLMVVGFGMLALKIASQQANPEGVFESLILIVSFLFVFDGLFNVRASYRGFEEVAEARLLDKAREYSREVTE